MSDEIKTTEDILENGFILDDSAVLKPLPKKKNGKK